MPVYTISNGQLIDKHTGEPAPPLTGVIAAPAVRADSMRSVRSMADGRVYDSRSEYDAHLRATGHRIADPGEKPADPEVKMSAAEKARFAEVYNARSGKS